MYVNSPAEETQRAETVLASDIEISVTEMLYNGCDSTAKADPDDSVVL